MKKSINVLVLNNNFYGSYSSNQVFFDELVCAFQSIGINTFTASSVEEAMSIFESNKINFSISFSKYQYFYNGVPLYEIYKVLNYQWVSDNPIKMNLDSGSKWIKYIFIDEEYPLAMKKTQNDCLFLPLGYLEKNVMQPSGGNGRVLIPCKVRNINQLYCEIATSSHAKQMKKFLGDYDRNSSFIKSFKKFIEENTAEINQDKERIFRLLNEYVRIEKRLWAIEHVYSMPVDILSEDCGNIIKNKNASFIEPVSYSELSSLINQYAIVINVDPNYHVCIHDRFIKAISSGAICVTNENMMINKITQLTYSFNEPNSISLAIEQTLRDDQWNEQMGAIMEYSWEKSARKIADDYICREVLL